MLNFHKEKQLFKEGYSLIVGVDEVGRGTVAGPIVAAAVIMDLKKSFIQDVRDSKKLTHIQRLKLEKKIKERALCWGVGEVSQWVIDKHGIQAANKLALKLAVKNLNLKPDFVLIDYFKLPDLGISNKSIVGGDAKIYSIACASIIAKIYRDAIMIKEHQNFPEYNFLTNKGYLTKYHLEAICEYGFCDLHRQSFWPMSKILETL